MSINNMVTIFKELVSKDVPPAYSKVEKNDASNNDLLKMFEKRIKITRKKHPEIPIDLIQSALELEDVNSNSGQTVRNKYILGYLDPNDRQQCFIYPYQTLKNKVKKDSNIDYLISQMKFYCVSELNKFLNATNADLNDYHKKELRGKKQFEKDYKKMLQTAKFINWGNHIIVDPSANDRLTYFSTEDLIDLVENYFIPGWTLTRSFKLPKGTIDKDLTLDIVFYLAKSKKVDISRVSIIKIKSYNVGIQRCTQREIIQDLTKAKDNGIENFLNFWSVTENSEKSKDAELFCLVLISDAEITNKWLLNLRNNRSLSISGQDIEITMIFNPIFSEHIR